MLKTPKHIVSAFLLFAFILNFSCRKETMEFEQAPPEDTLSPTSQVANLMRRTTMNDGAIDNIIDQANCFSVQLPATVSANGVPVTVASSSDFNTIEALFDEDDYNTDTIEIVFPITILLNDFTQATVNSMAELNIYSGNCNGENQMDDDIECVDFQYPISASIFDVNNEFIYSETLTNDNMMFQFINAIDENDLVTIDFPVTIEISDGTNLAVNSLTELQNAIENFADYCDEDDDFDYNDDDCNGCTPLELTEILTNCPDWMVDKLKRNGNDYDDSYDGYVFNFFTDGTVSVSWNATTANGTWTASGTGNNITVEINIPSLPYCNLDWNLNQIEESVDGTKIDFRRNDDNRMRYENTCN